MKFHQPARQPVQTFAASFDGDCETCFVGIYEGDQIGYLPGDDKPSCDDCVAGYNEGIEE